MMTRARHCKSSEPSCGVFLYAHLNAVLYRSGSTVTTLRAVLKMVLHQQCHAVQSFISDSNLSVQLPSTVLNNALYCRDSIFIVELRVGRTEQVVELEKRLLVRGSMVTLCRSLHRRRVSVREECSDLV